MRFTEKKSKQYNMQLTKWCQLVFEGVRLFLRRYLGALIMERNFSSETGRQIFRHLNSFLMKLGRHRLTPLFSSFTRLDQPILWRVY